MRRVLCGVRTTVPLRVQQHQVRAVRVCLRVCVYTMLCRAQPSHERVCLRDAVSRPTILYARVGAVPPYATRDRPHVSARSGFHPLQYQP